MKLETDRLILRRWTESDAESLYEYAKDPAVGPIAGWPPHKSISESLSVIRNVLNGSQCYAICEKDSNKAIGSIELKLSGHTDMTDKDDECELGYWLGKPFWGRGYMPEAVRELLRYGFETLGMSVIWCGYYDGNDKSKRVQEKVGFVYHHTCEEVPVPLMNEIRIGHTNYMTKKHWEKLKFEAEFSKLGNDYKTKDLDRFNRSLIKRNENVAFLGDIIISNQKYHRTFFQVSLAQLKTIEEKLAFIEDNFDKLQDWWHVDQLSQFVDKYLTFDLAYEKAEKYIRSELPFARRWGYVMFMPTLVKNEDSAEKLFLLFKDDDEYYVQMAEAWLISYLGIYHPEKTLAYLKECPLKYNIVGKAIQKICDSFRVEDEMKARFKELRKRYK